MMGSKAFESPLISHARMRAMFRALVETRLLARRAGRQAVLPKGLEACWVGTAIDLKAGDLTSVARGDWLLDYVRDVGARENAGAATKAEVARALRGLGEQKSKTSDASAFERLLGAAGMARAVQGAGAAGVVVAYAGSGELSAIEWKRVLTVAMEDELPLAIVTMPTERMVDVGGVVRRMGVRTIPVIPVDAGDVVALYRVAQETLLRARGDGGVAVIECMNCKVDPMRLMTAQLVKKKICTERWVQSVETAFRATLAKV